MQRFLVVMEDGVVCSAHTNRSGDTVDVRPLKAVWWKMVVRDDYGAEWPISEREIAREECNLNWDRVTYEGTVDVDGVPHAVVTYTRKEVIIGYDREQRTEILARAVASHQESTTDEARWEEFVADPKLTNKERGRFKRVRGNAARWLLERRGFAWSYERETAVRALVCRLGGT